MTNGPADKKSGLHAKIISGSVVLLSGSTLSVGINLGYNVTVAHFLGPEGFGNANAVYTLLTLISAVALSFQIVTAKIVAQQSDEATRDAAYRNLQRAAWVSGVLVGLVLIVLQRRITTYLNLPSAQLVVILAFGAAFYVPLGSRRGYIQGAFGFGKLATNLVFEGAARLIGSVVMVALGFGVTGVIVANAAAMAVAYFAIAPKLTTAGVNPLSFEVAFREVSHAAVFFAGQVIINNCDIVLVKHFFSSGEAGLYAVIALVGRVTFACSSAIVNSMFPIIAGSKQEDRKNLSLIGTALALVLAVGSVLAIGLRFTPTWVWATLFGSRFQILGQYTFSRLLALYAIMTVIYCLSVVVMTYEMSYKIANTDWIQLVFSGILIAGICRYHDTLQQVIMVQLALLVAFLVLIAVHFIVGSLSRADAFSEVEGRKLRLLRPIGEDAVIAEFLKSDFENPAYGQYHDTLRGVVSSPDLENKAECDLRRALLALRHCALWRELPLDTRWYEVEIKANDLDRIRVFPRAQWTRVAYGNFAITKVAARVERRMRRGNDSFVGKISDIREDLSENVLNAGSVILIGCTESDLLTILDGNHRFVAGVLEGKIERLKFVCGLSNNMTQCCWYRTNLFNLARYGRNRLRHYFHIPSAEPLRFCESSDSLPNKRSLSPL